MKRCARCKTTKSLTQFGRNRRRIDGVSVYCLLCKAEDQMARYHSDPVRHNANNQRSKRKNLYGVTQEQFDAMVAAREGRCDICQRVSASTLCVDHDHVTRQVRGLLCGPCNRAIGILGDTLEGVLRAVAYLATDAVAV